MRMFEPIEGDNKGPATMYRSAYEAYHAPRCFKPWQAVCKTENDSREESRAWEGPRKSDLTATQLVKLIRKGMAR